MAKLPKQPQAGPTVSHEPESRFSLRDPKTVVPLASVFISFLALALAIYQGYLQRDFLRVSNRPRMVVSFYYNDKGSGFLFGDRGMGHATLKVFEVLVDGRAQVSWLEMFHTLGFAAAPPFQFVVPRPEAIYKPDSEEQVVWLDPGPYSEEMKQKQGRILVRACYCSVFDECWRVDSRGSHESTGTACPTPVLTFGAPPVSVQKP
jgi:hypothetical protein